MRKLILILLILLAARMAKRALARGGGPYAEITAALWAIAGQLALAGTANTPKTRDIENRLNAAMPRIPWPQAAPGTTAGGAAGGSNSSYSASNSSYSASNSSYSTSNGSYSDNDSLQGPASSPPTQAQVQAAIDRINHLLPAFGALQGSYSNTVPALNALQASHSSLVPAFNALRQSHSDLVPAFNTLQASHSSLVPVVSNLASDHNQLINDHNNLKSALLNAGVLE